MKCHYEVLDISREADDNEIKTAYRKLALKWHPDKNLGNTEHAKEQFQLVQQAYEVLSDRQERAWYDKHREQILRGSDSDYKDSNLDVFQYFTTTCFKGYGDDENGFYCTYGRVFEQIAKEDYEYMDDNAEVHTIPKFGNAESNYDEIVAPFYDYWMSYSTKKSYVWLDPHNIKEASNRKIFKLIEKENDKIRQKAKRERNEEVRNLVAFVRKRDKRVQAHIKKLEEKKVENREKQKKISNQQRLERIKQLNESSEQAEWMKFDNVKSELEEVEKKLAAQFGDDTSNSEENSDTDEMNNLYCVACNKIFKTAKAFKNHESSKKHRENVENLKEIMLKDDLSEEDLSNSSEENEQQISDANNQVEDIVTDLSFNEKMPEANGILGSKTRKKNKKGKNVIRIIENDSEEETNNEVLQNNDNNSENELLPTKKQKRKKRKDRTKKDDIGVMGNENGPTSNKEASVVSKGTTDTELDSDRCCAKCKAQFPSKNKLFEHLKKTGHSCYVNTTNVVDKSKKKSVKQK
ncbi:hypothetical protein Trydic_g2136 [Trypoxylus dichotomus]